MKYDILVSFTDEENTAGISYIGPGLMSDCYSINLLILPDKKIEDVLSLENFKKKSLDFVNSIAGFDFDLIDEEIEDEEFMSKSKIIEKLLEINNSNILENCNIVFLEDTEEALDFYENNPSLKANKICIMRQYNANHEDLNLVKEKYGKYDNFYYMLEGNEEYISLANFEKTVVLIDDIVNEIMKYDLSPLEQMMYAYDKVRDRVYVLEDEGEAYTTSRDLTSVLLGDKIVCSGYAHIYDAILKRLNIKSMVRIIRNMKKKTKHAKNIVYVEDYKYNVFGVFDCDTTWDSKKEDDFDQFLFSYRFFCNLKSYVEQYGYYDETFEGYNINTASDFEKIVKEKGITAVPNKMFSSINSVAMFIDGKTLINKLLKFELGHLPSVIADQIASKFNLDNVLDRLHEYEELFFNRKLDIDTLVQVLFNVRKIEYYENPDRYMFNKDVIAGIIRTSNWLEGYNRELGILKKIFGEEDEVDEYLNEFLTKNNMERDIERVKLTKTLKMAYEKKKLQK